MTSIMNAMPTAKDHPMMSHPTASIMASMITPQIIYGAKREARRNLSTSFVARFITRPLDLVVVDLRRRALSNIAAKHATLNCILKESM
jgi:hypothetical protein